MWGARTLDAKLSRGFGGMRHDDTGRANIAGETGLVSVGGMSWCQGRDLEGMRLSGLNPGVDKPLAMGAMQENSW